jgi:hypothetical protein
MKKIKKPKTIYSIVKLHKDKLDCGKEVLLVKVGNNEYPAVEDEILEVANDINNIFIKQAISHADAIISHHDISLEYIPVNRKDILVVRVGSNYRPAMEEDLKDIRDNIKKILKHNNIDMPCFVINESTDIKSITPKDEDYAHLDYVYKKEQLASQYFDTKPYRFRYLKLK